MNYQGKSAMSPQVDQLLTLWASETTSSFSRPERASARSGSGVCGTDRDAGETDDHHLATPYLAT